jgi:hypothetical protein
MLFLKRYGCTVIYLLRKNARIIFAFVAAPIGAIVVFASVLMTTVVKNESWAGFMEALIGGAVMIYLFYGIGLFFILPTYIELKSKGQLTWLSTVGLGTAFGFFVGLVFRDAGWAWVPLGSVMGAASGMLFALLQPD